MSASTKIIQAAAGVDTGGPAGDAWNISTAQWLAEDVNYFFVGLQDGLPNGMYFKPDGTKLYVIGASGDNVYEYDIDTPWDVSTASFLQTGVNVNAQETTPEAVFFKPDGTKMYITGDTSDSVHEYDLSTAWDSSSASFLQSFSVSTKETVAQGLFFKPDGTKMYVIGQASDDVHEYDLSTAWDISSASFLQSFAQSEDNAPCGIFFRSDGTKMYLAGRANDEVFEYDLSTAWDVSSASYLQNFDINSQDGTLEDVFFKSDGSIMYIIGSASDRVFQYQLSTAWDISSASYQEPTTRYFNVLAQDDISRDVFFKSDGTKMYVIGSRNDSVYEYDLSTEWDISTASYLQAFSVSSQEAGPTALFFKPDGTEMYICGTVGDDTNQYTLSTAWDISSASYTRTFDSSSQEVSPQGIFFKSDGTKMYITGALSDAINEYDLSTAWDISSASFLQSFSIGTQNNQPTGLFFKPDGLKMYAIGKGGGTEPDSVSEYDLSTAWDVSTASYLQSFSVALQDDDPEGLFFKPDGLKMYVLGGRDPDAIYEYDL